MATEFDLIVLAVRKLRERDRYHSKKLPNCRLTYWDADDYRLQLLSRNLDPVRMKTKFGYTLEIWPECPKSEVIRTKNEVIVRCDGSHIVEFQFAPEAHLDLLGKAGQEFEELDLFELTFDGKEAMVDYCRKMDAVIVEVAKELNKKRVASVFDKLWKEFGGSTDRVVRRVKWYGDLASLYAQDKNRWLPEMKAVGLL